MSTASRQAPLRQRIRTALILLSFLLFPITLNFLSPYLIVMGAAEGVITGSFLLFGALFIGTLFLGRLWCGWVCPGAGMARLAAPINARGADQHNGLQDRARGLDQVGYLGALGASDRFTRDQCRWLSQCRSAVHDRKRHLGG